MFKKTIPTFVLLIVCYNCFPQETRELNWQKFLTSVKTTEIANPVKTGEFTIFQVTDINKFLYKVEISGRVFELQTPIPTELQTLFRLTPTQLEQKANTNKIKEGAAIIDSQIENMKNAKEKVEEKSNTVEIATGAPNPALENLSSSLDNVIKECKKYLSKSNSLSMALFDLKSTRNKLILIAQADKSFNDIKSMLNEVTIPATETIKEDYSISKQLYEKVEKLYEEAIDIANDASITANKDIIKKITDAAKAIEEADELISEEALLGLLDDVDFLYKELGNKNNFTVVSPPVQMDGDIVSYTVNITPSVTRTLGANKSPMQFKFDIPAKRGLKVDFGVGPAFSFGKNSRDDKYFLKESTSPDMVKLTKLDNNNAISPGLVAMMNIYSRSGKGTALGGLFGVGAGFQGMQDINLSLYTGVSVVMGKREKVMIGLGCSWLKVERLKNTQFEVDKDYQISKIVLSEVTEKVFKPSFFLSICYNLTNRIEVK